MDTAAIRQAIRDLDRVFLADMEALPAEAWQQPSDCDGWTIAGAFIHIVQVSELLGDSLARGRAGDPGPPPLAASDGVQAWRAARNGPPAGGAHAVQRRRDRLVPARRRRDRRRA